MKKLMGISVIAMLAVAAGFSAHAAAVAGEPAHADSPVRASAEPEFALVEAGDNDTKAASAGYVKGAYNAAIKAINKVNQKVTTNAGDGLTKDGNTMAVDLATNSGLEISGGKLKVDAADGSIALGANGASVALTDNKGLTKDATNGTLEVKAGNGIALDSTGVKVVAGDGIAVDSNGVAVDLKTNGGLTTDNGEVKVVVDDSTIAVDSTNGQIKIKNGVQGATDTATYSETGLTTKGYVDEAIATTTNGMVTLTGTQELSNKTLNGGTLKTGTTLTATGATISGGTVSGATITGATIDASANTISNIDVGDMANSALATGDADNDKVTTKGYVDDAITDLRIGDYATKTGVDNTINALTASSNVGEFTLASGTVGGTATIDILTDWSNPNTATTLTVDTSALAVGTAINEGSVTTTINKTAYASAQGS